jgi:hypothetical protein
VSSLNFHGLEIELDYPCNNCLTKGCDYCGDMGMVLTENGEALIKFINLHIFGASDQPGRDGTDEST